MSTWIWKPKEGVASGLLYEPGNWGDLLKGAWIVEIVRFIAENQAGQNLRIADVFAGAPTYPISGATRRRLRELRDLPLQKICAPFVEANLWPSAASLAAATANEQNAEVELQVCDQHDERRAAYEECSQMTILPGKCGYEALRPLSDEHFDLLVVDPYDFLKDWSRELPALLKAAQHSTVLLYIYNRSGRGGRELRKYRDFRNALEDGWGGSPSLLGRVPADGFLPTCFHEMLLLPGPADAPLMPQKLFPELRRQTLQVEACIRDSAVVEESP